MRDYYGIQTINPPPDLEAELISLGLYDYQYQEKGQAFPGKTSPLATLRLNLPVDDPRLPAVLELQQQYRLLGAYFTEFSDDDYAGAAWLEVEITSWIGYPKPENRWKEVTYDLAHSDYCLACGAGFVQANPFRFARTHERGKTVSFCRPGWVYDALFIRAAVQKDLLAEGIQGIHYLPAIEAGSKRAFEDVIQVVFDYVLEPALLNVEDFPFSLCEACGRRKWQPMHRVNRFRRAQFDDRLDMVMTREWFGAGALAFRKILVSRRFAELLQERRWRGLKLRPIILD